MNRQKHLYLILFPNEALVGSQLSPEEFGKHYSVGSPRHFTGKVIFAEIDQNYRDPYFSIDEQLNWPPTGARPKHTRFIKSYRVLEHMDFSAIKCLYLVTTDGAVLGLHKGQEPERKGKHDRVRVYQEICPLRLLVASNLNPTAFGRYITEESWTKGAPKIFFAQYDIDVEEFVARKDVRAFNMGILPNVNPTNLPTALKELTEDPEKKTKTVSLNPSIGAVSYKLIQPGYWFAGGGENVFFRMPTLDELHEEHHEWWRHL